MRPRRISREIVQPGYDLTKVEVYECTAQEFQLGFEAEEAQILIDLDSSVEEIEKRADAKEGQTDTAPKKKIAPGDFVIASKKPGKGKNLGKRASGEKG